MDDLLAVSRIRTRPVLLAAVVAVSTIFTLGPGATFSHASGSGDTYPAKIQVLRAGVEEGRLDVLADMTKRADGDQVSVSFIANGKHFRFNERVKDGRLRFKQLLPSSQRRMSTGIVELRYKGNDRVRPSNVRLRAANGKGRLERDGLSLHNGIITARGSLSDRVDGVVRLILSYERPDGTVGEWQGRAPIADDGTWRLEEGLPADARGGGYLSVQFTGYYPRRIRGEQIAKQLLEGQSFGFDEPMGVGAATDVGMSTLRSVGSPPLSDADAAARVRRSAWEPRPENTTYNHTMPGDSQLQSFYAADSWGSCGNPMRYRVTGHFTGTTDEILQWASHKWGLDEDVLRAIAVVESWWRQSAGDQTGGGLISVTTSAKGAFPMYRESTAFNVDYLGATLRYYYDGCGQWLNTVLRGQQYVAGDLWGSIGTWYSGRWYANGSDWYIGRVQSELQNRTWERAGF